MDLKSALSSFEGNKILVLGDIILDIYIRGSVDRISPEAPIPILNHKQTSHALGGAANVAANLQGLGADVTILSVSGQDNEAEYLITLMDLEGIQHKLIPDPSRSTTSKTRVIAGNHQMIRIDHENTHEIDDTISNQILGYVSALCKSKDIKAIVLEDYNKGVLHPSLIQAIITEARSMSIPTIIDPKQQHFFEYKHCDLFKPNFKECAAQVPFLLEHTLQSLSKADEYLRSKLNHRLTMITMAEHGIFISDGHKKHIVPTSIRKISDVSGAGDTVTAIATFGLLQSLSLLEIATLANQAAGHVCEIPGVYAIKKEELLN